MFVSFSKGEEEVDFRFGSSGSLKDKGENEEEEGGEEEGGEEERIFNPEKQYKIYLQQQKRLAAVICKKHRERLNSVSLPLPDLNHRKEKKKDGGRIRVSSSKGRLERVRRKTVSSVSASEFLRASSSNSFETSCYEQSHSVVSECSVTELVADKEENIYQEPQQSEDEEKELVDAFSTIGVSHDLDDTDPLYVFSTMNDLKQIKPPRPPPPRPPPPQLTRKSSVPDFLPPPPPKFKSPTALTPVICNEGESLYGYADTESPFSAKGSEHASGSNDFDDVIYSTIDKNWMSNLPLDTTSSSRSQRFGVCVNSTVTGLLHRGKPEHSCSEEVEYNFLRNHISPKLIVYIRIKLGYSFLHPSRSISIDWASLLLSLLPICYYSRPFVMFVSISRGEEDVVFSFGSSGSLKKKCGEEEEEEDERIFDPDKEYKIYLQRQKRLAAVNHKTHRERLTSVTLSLPELSRKEKRKEKGKVQGSSSLKRFWKHVFHSAHSSGDNISNISSPSILQTVSSVRHDPKQNPGTSPSTSFETSRHEKSNSAVSECSNPVSEVDKEEEIYQEPQQTDQEVEEKEEEELIYEFSTMNRTDREQEEEETRIYMFSTMGGSPELDDPLYVFSTTNDVKQIKPPRPPPPRPPPPQLTRISSVPDFLPPSPPKFKSPLAPIPDEGGIYCSETSEGESLYGYADRGSPGSAKGSEHASGSNDIEEVIYSTYDRDWRSKLPVDKTNSRHSILGFVNSTVTSLLHRGKSEHSLPADSEG
eukprot:sb/3462354/